MPLEPLAALAGGLNDVGEAGRFDPDEDMLWCSSGWIKRSKKKAGKGVEMELGACREKVD
jgi:hypothetical protein